MRPDGCIDCLSNWFVRETEGGCHFGGNAAHTSCVPAGDSADPTWPTVEGGESGLNLFLQQRSTAATPQLENLSVWERLRKDTQGLMTHSKWCEIPNHENRNVFSFSLWEKKIHEMSVVLWLKFFHHHMWKQWFKTVWTVWLWSERYFILLIIKQWNLQKLSKWNIENKKELNFRRSESAALGRIPAVKMIFGRAKRQECFLRWTMNLEKWNTYGKMCWERFHIIIYITVCKPFTI